MKKGIVVNVFVFLFYHLNAQKPNWQNLDLQKDSVFGISTEKAYTEILNHKKKFRPVIVGVIDSGVDTAHEDLKSVIWINPKEKYNGKDNDHDGYKGDVHGWDFIGGAHGDIDKENLELTRLVRAGRADSIMLSEYNEKFMADKQTVENTGRFINILDSIAVRLNKDSPQLADFQYYKPQNDNEQRVKAKAMEVMQDGMDYAAWQSNLKDYLNHFRDELDYDLNPGFNPRPSIVGDDSSNAFERFYGNPDVMGPDALHGTHVSGIIAAVRDNGIGIQGIANHVSVLMIRTVPAGDERDKDVANAIRFAVDHGCKVVNMSFGKSWSPDKKAVDEAVRYAMSKDVLLIQAAGNESKNIDHEPNFPNRRYLDGTEAGAYLVVGASGMQNDSTLVADFSNYGKTSVDVFAPGVDIYSCVPGSKYQNESGTSMAAPVVTGLAALIREYYPKLTALQVKRIIMQSVVKPVQNIHVRDGAKERSVPLSEISVSGGIVNVYKALLLCQQ